MPPATVPVTPPARSALHWAALSCGTDVLRALLRLTHARLIDVEDASGYTPLTLAAEHGRLEAVECLLQRGANPLVRSKLGLLAVAIADWYGHKKIVEVLDKVTTERWATPVDGALETLHLGGAPAAPAVPPTPSSGGLTGVNPATAASIALLPR